MIMEGDDDEDAEDEQLDQVLVDDLDDALDLRLGDVLGLDVLEEEVESVVLVLLEVLQRVPDRVVLLRLEDVLEVVLEQGVVVAGLVQVELLVEPLQEVLLVPPALLHDVVPEHLLPDLLHHLRVDRHLDLRRVQVVDHVLVLVVVVHEDPAVHRDGGVLVRDVDDREDLVALVDHLRGVLDGPVLEEVPRVLVPDPVLEHVDRLQDPLLVLDCDRHYHDRDHHLRLDVVLLDDLVEELPVHLRVHQAEVRQVQVHEVQVVLDHEAFQDLADVVHVDVEDDLLDVVG